MFALQAKDKVLNFTLHCHCEPEEVVTAVNLAKDLKSLQSLRANLRDMMRYSALCDVKRFTSI
ncbi:MAG: hypothetical protein L6N96_03210 [Candidatus Methylarchaceae archaeon HK02M2]|nr:hypothetical protein [Candidatus Methylarchaceae archaeon HK02M2]